MAAAGARHDFNEILEVMVYEDSSDDSSSSNDDDDLDLLLVDTTFQKEDMERLLHALQLPAYYECVQRTKCTGMEALMILLRRLVYPSRWCDLVPVFGRDEPQLSLIFSKVMDDIYERFNHFLTSLDLVWLDPEMFSQAVEAKGAPLHQC
ncbi:hypothetical protein P5673_027052 [Acropora cervicornis]|uniref:Uncharacterized protein n=1 Tax=Acropora cervicornis TaxID=6130 RepID=A0AAD9PZM9_ACRCE|nr:hypothetical protein P5673_027052 [Acropora cervicornis]